MLVFLGGTCNGSTWRDELILLLKNVDYFNPVVPEWNEECRLKEMQARRDADVCLYCLTPEMVGYYSIAELIDDSNKKPAKVIMCALREANGKRFSDKEWTSIKAIERMAEINGVITFECLEDLAGHLNTKALFS